jgi:hypothetical protein
MRTRIHDPKTGETVELKVEKKETVPKKKPVPKAKKTDK